MPREALSRIDIGRYSIVARSASTQLLISSAFWVSKLLQAGQMKSR